MGLERKRSYITGSKDLCEGKEIQISLKLGILRMDLIVGRVTE